MQATDVLAIGVDTDQYETLPSVQKCIVSSATKNVEGAVRNSLLRIAQDQFKAGCARTTPRPTASAWPPSTIRKPRSRPTKTLIDTTFAGLADGTIKPAVTVDGR